jgi:exodeoxyribonuclease V alpha subunit
MSAAVLLDEFDDCADQGLLRSLGCAFARFIDALEPVPPCVLLACVLLTELESRGHACLALDDLLEDPCAQLGLDPEACARLRAALGGLPTSSAEWAATLAQCRQVYSPGKEDCNQPLVLAHARLYLRRFWRAERSIAQRVEQALAMPRAVDTQHARTLLDRLFPHGAGDEPDWQKIACALAARSSVSIITGGPGTGKTYTAARLLALLCGLSAQPGRMRFALAAPSGKAAIRLRQSIDLALAGLRQVEGLGIDIEGLIACLPSARTLHGLLGANPETRSARYHAGRQIDVDVLVVDEASMIDLQMMADLLNALPPHAMLVLLGDKDQLPSVEAGSVLGELCADAQAGRYDASTAAYVAAAAGETVPPSMVTGGPTLAQCTAMLRKSQRFGGAIGRVAIAVNAGDVAHAKSCLLEAGGDAVTWQQGATQFTAVELAVKGRLGAGSGYAGYLGLVHAGPALGSRDGHDNWVKSVLDAFEQFRLLCPVREGQWGVEGLNAAIEERLLREKLIAVTGEWYAGRPVMVTRNDHALGIFNGDVGVALPDAAPGRRLRVYFWKDEGVTGILPTRLPHVETAYAMTVHKVQGSEFAHAALVLPGEAAQGVNRELIYTAITRARQRLTLLTPDVHVFLDGVQRQASRASGLRCFMHQDEN